MNTPEKIGIITIRAVNGTINTFVLVIILLLLAFGCYALWDSGQVYSNASHSRYERYKPTIENEGVSFEQLQAINPDVLAWLTVYGTNIDYPMVQGLDNMRYVNTSAEGRYSLSGAIFLDYRNSPDFSDFNNITYGHHMESRAMFGEIALFSDKSYFDARKYGKLFVDGKEYGLEFFAFVHTGAGDREIFRVNIVEQEARQAYLDLILDMAINTRKDVSVTAEDRIILLSTCSPNSTSGRDILVAKIVEDIQSDPFEVIPAETPPSVIPTIDKLPDLWEQVMGWIKNRVSTSKEVDNNA
ncbi:MAG: class B sortase [Firmicutes bacterium]|nr:class B sortase [Bacillota bacterium]